MPDPEPEYVLGTGPREVERLFAQHCVWREHVLRCWRAARFRPGQRLLDLGCGPGAATLDLAELAGPSGEVIGVDASSAFLNTLRDRAAARGLSNIRTDCSDVLRWTAADPLDGIWCRWLLSFVREPVDLVRSMSTWCRAGARVAIHEYCDYGAWRLHPAVPELDEFVSAVMRGWRDSGGEPDRGLVLPELLAANGFRIVRSRPIAQVLTVHDPAWSWLTGFIASGLVRLQQIGYLTPPRAFAIEKAVRRSETTPGALMIAPTVLELVAEREG